MGFRVYHTNESKAVEVDENGLDEWGLPFQCRVSTSKYGPGSIAGSRGGKLYVLLDSDKPTGVVMEFSLSDIGTAVVSDSPVPPSPVKAHPLKAICYKSRNVRIIMQRERGPCPVFAVANALALQGKIDLIADYGVSIKEETLNRTLCQYFRSIVKPAPLLSSVEAVQSRGTATPMTNTEDIPLGKPKTNTLANFLKDTAAFRTLAQKCCAPPPSPDSIEERISGLYKGLDLDVVFTGVEDFLMEGWSVVFFSLFGFRIFHAWVIGEAMEPFHPLKHFTYNELTILLVTSPANRSAANGTGSDSEQNSLEALRPVAQLFYERTSAVQMTSAGYVELLQSLKDGEIGVLFWQNHFFTVTKLNGMPVVLLTDDSFSRQPSFVFATISCESFSLEEFLDSNGNCLDPYVAFIAANSFVEFTNEEIGMAQLSLEKELQRSVTPQELLTHMLAHSTKKKEYRQESLALKEAQKKVVGETNMTELVKSFLEVFPEVETSKAEDVLRKSDFNLNRAVERFLSES